MRVLYNEARSETNMTIMQTTMSIITINTAPTLTHATTINTKKIAISIPHPDSRPSRN